MASGASSFRLLALQRRSGKGTGAAERMGRK
jgi:hypothetical protein